MWWKDRIFVIFLVIGLLIFNLKIVDRTNFDFFKFFTYVTVIMCFVFCGFFIPKK